MMAQVKRRRIVRSVLTARIVQSWVGRGSVGTGRPAPVADVVSPLDGCVDSNGPATGQEQGHADWAHLGRVRGDAPRLARNDARHPGRLAAGPGAGVTDMH